MRLVLDIAWTHVRSRVRQSLVGMFGIAMGVGFSVMMAGLMEGGQRDFVSQLVDSLPHITVSDDRRSPPRQPAEQVYQAAEISGLSTAALRPGIKNPYAIIAALDTWIEGATAPSVQARAVIRYASRDVAASITGIDPRREVRVSKLATQVRQGSLDSLYKASNAIIIGDKLATRIGARVGNTIALVSGTGKLVPCTVVGLLHTGISQNDETQAVTLLKTAQILSGQTGLVNAIRIRAVDIMAAREMAQRVEAETGYKAVSWQEANEDLLNRIPDPQFHHVHRRRRDPARRLVRNLQHHLDDHAREDARHRDPEIARLHCGHRAPDLPARSPDHRHLRHA